MTRTSREHADLAARGPGLRRYAETLTDDVNAACLLVHRTLTHALRSDGADSGRALRGWLRSAFEREGHERP
jgi:hypothetical protein